MEENTEYKQQAQPQAENENGELQSEATTPQCESSESEVGTVRIKYNKQTIDLPIDEAAVLAQKGLKYDSILPQIERLRSLAADGGKSIAEYICEIEERQKNKHREEVLDFCGGNEAATERILELEGKNSGEGLTGMEDLMREFPEISGTGDIPQSVIDSVKTNGGSILNAYMLYEHRQRRAAAAAADKQIKNRMASVGSQHSSGPEENGLNTEFIKGLWS